MDTTKPEILICAKCGTALTKGYVQVPSVSLAWSPITKKKSEYARFNWQVDSDEIRLGTWNFFKGSKVPADLCETCKTIFIQYDND